MVKNKYLQIFSVLPILALAFAIATTSTSCKSDGGGGAGVVPDSILNAGITEIDPDVMKDVVDNLASPVEMAALIKNQNVSFSNKYLAPTDKIDNYTTSFDQAFNLGIYGADLGYLNMYNKTNAVLDYISAIKTLADAIRVGQFFDFSTLKRLAQNNQNLDSLMYISQHSYNQMDKYLRSSNRGNLSTLIITGVWMEGLYLATQVYKEAPDPAIKERIGEQKLIIADLILVLELYKKDQQIANLLKDLYSIQEEFDDVTISYEKGEPTMEEVDGMLVIVQNDVSIVNISDERIESIITKTEKIRNKLISN